MTRTALVKLIDWSKLDQKLAACTNPHTFGETFTLALPAGLESVIPWEATDSTLHFHGNGDDDHAGDPIASVHFGDGGRSFHRLEGPSFAATDLDGLTERLAQELEGWAEE